jgi:undecaprenyl-diphosphatase
VKDSLLVGLAQCVALVPGISRSGSTISAGLMLGIDRAEAARFSFLLSIPVILGAAVLESRKMNALPDGQGLPLLAGVLAAAVTGYIALLFLMRVVKAAKLHWFAWYCWGMGVMAVSYFWATK